jgi:putative two-component system response regulator
MVDGYVLVVDDDPQIRAYVAKVLANEGYEVDTACDVEEARAQLARGRYALVLLDVAMPGMSGLDFLGELVSSTPEVVTVMVTAHDDASLADAALALGAYSYVVKPFRRSDLLINVSSALKRRQLELDGRLQHSRLEEIVQRRTADLREALQRLHESEREVRRSHEQIVRKLARAVELRDVDTGSHIERVSFISGILARRLGLAEDHCELIRHASGLHDIGKVAVPDRILLKDGPLTTEERIIMERHAEIGFEILRGARSELLDAAASIARTHHERFDGHGYPRRLVGCDIPLEGRLTAVADAFDAITHDRPYRSARTLDEAVEIIWAERGVGFDPDVVDSFIAALDEIASGLGPSDLTDLRTPREV